MQLPSKTAYLLSRLNAAGYEAYAVGGCVRDTLRGTEPHDWDVCTSALPEELHAALSDLRLIDTGIAHGTVTVLLEGEPLEVTTFRTDGTYTDHRRPDSVTFVRSLTEDLARRDFTINAMACGPDGEVVDLYGGKADLAAGLLRCVGDPETRFREDALRILRALRFSAQLDFVIEEKTAAAAHALRGTLRQVSSERVLVELTKLLTGAGAPRILREYPDVLGVVLPELLPSVGFEQRNPCHYEDVWNHTVTALSLSEPEINIRWALLLHDLGKPASFRMDENGIGHFPNHPYISRELADTALRRLRMENDRREQILNLVLLHDATLPVTRRGVLRWVEKYGADTLQKLCEVRRCDGLAHTSHPPMERVRASTEQFRVFLKETLETGLPFRPAQLAINGNDLQRLGLKPGPAMGQCLRRLLDAVQEERCPNEREPLLAYFEENREALT